MEYLSMQEIISMKEDIKHEMELLLSNKAIVLKPNSLQWMFFSDCINKLFNSNHPSKFISLNNSNKAQLKFETEDKLRKFYLRPGRKINFVFQMIHKKDLKKIFFDEDDSYPDIGGYSILVRDTSKENSSNNILTEKDVKDYIERVVTEAIETEFKSYMMLPNIIPDIIIDKWFIPDSPAVKEIMHVVLRHKERGWTLSNPMNPSSKRIIDMKVRKTEKGEVFVSTIEYWYLRWWDTNKKAYTFPYRETNRQQYVLRKHEGMWKVYETIRPQPRTSIPHRRKYY
ncbi:MAG: hypothetical protein NTX22_13995 [Ignavibacteriales bacterium]|nr:hypothetical protein [Ignavibacteriales bacterium]